MGMFDHIKIDKEVVLPLLKKLDGIDTSKLDFQTKCLDNCLFTYVIKKDGLYLFKEDKLVNTEFHGILDFGAYHDTDLVGYLFDFKAKYTDGSLVDIKLYKFQEFFHDSNEKRHKSLVKQFKDKKKKSPLFFLQSVLVFILNFFNLGVTSNFLGVISKGHTFFSLYCPRLTFFRRDGYYGLMLENIDFGFKLRSSSYENTFCFKIFGFGFDFRRYKLDLLEKLSDEEY
jgi:hypothetical protein